MEASLIGVQYFASIVQVIVGCGYQSRLILSVSLKSLVNISAREILVAILPSVLDNGSNRSGWPFSETNLSMLTS